MKLSNRIIKKFQAADFIYQYNDGCHSFGKYTDYGQDFSFDVYANNKEELLEGVHNYYESFDPSQEAYYWLDETGHGKNGAPYEMQAVLDDMKQCEEYIYNVFEILSTGPNR